MSIEIMANEMRDLGGLVDFALHDDKGRDKKTEQIGWALLTFDFKTDTGMINYISNAQRENMIKALKELIINLETAIPFQTPTEN